MLKARDITVLAILLPVLLLISSCKKQVIKSTFNNSNKSEIENETQKNESHFFTLEDSAVAVGGAKVFSPIDDFRAKQFVRDIKVSVDQNQVSKEKATQDKKNLSPEINDQEILEISDFRDIQSSDGIYGDSIDSIDSIESIESIERRENIERREIFESADSIESIDSESFVCNKNKIDKSELVRQKEAKLSDIPVPLNSEPIMEYFGFKGVGNSGNAGNKRGEIILGYLSQMDIDQVVEFYNQEMEFFGWGNLSFFDGIEKLMLFKKPSRICSISIRSLSGRSGVGSWIRSKKSSSNNSRENKCEIIIFVQN